MRLSEVVIKNFRSIGPEGLTITFSQDRNVSALIGPNAAGKSNILQALAIVLGVFPFSKFEAEETDFHFKDTKKELLIELHLNPPLIERDVYQKQFEIHGFRYRARRKVRGDARGVLDDEHYCFGSDGNTIVKPTRIYKAKKKAEDVNIDNTFRPLTVKDYAWKVGTPFYLDASRLERFFDKTTGYTPLGRLFDLYRNDFAADHNKHELPDGQTPTSRDAFAQLAGALVKVLRTTKLKAIESALSKHVAQYLGGSGHDTLGIGFGLPSHRELFEKWVGLQVTERSDMPALPVENLGSGYRALFRLAVIETLLELSEHDRGYLLLVEEPEIYLHVHLRRYFSRVLRRMAEAGNQIVLTTHSPEFVDLAEPYEIVRLHKTSGETSSRQVPATQTFDFQKAKAKIRRMGNEEMLFANHAVLTEGKTDQTVTRVLFEKKGIDSNVHSISIVDCDNADNQPDYTSVCASLGIDFYVIHDEDDAANDPSQKKRNVKIANAVSAAKQKHPSLHRYAPNIEATLGKATHCGIEILLACLDGKTYQEIAAEYPDLVKPVDEFVTTRLPQPASTKSVAPSTSTA